MKKIIFSLLMLFAIVGPCYASNTIDFDEKGSISISLVELENNESISGAEIEVIKIADAKLDTNNNLAYEINKDITCTLDLSDLTKLDANKVNTCVNKDALSGNKGTTDRHGVVNFEELDLGLYLIRQTNELDEYSSIDPYLVTIPTIEENEWIYRLESMPKTEIIKLMNITVNKVWKTTKNIDNKVVKISLLLDKEVVEEIELTKENNWTYTVKVRANDSYSVLEEKIEGYKATYEKSGNTFTVINADELADTGEYTYLIYVLAISGMLLILTGLYLRKENN